ncbi:DMT family transporter [Stieleria mannarensis]|uniref:DMT family transporter n=1 Tax=Stieleria mannarensis TaxID=2755585 RepID=UPI0016039546
MSAERDSGSSDAWRGRGLIVLAAVMWSTSGFFAKAPWFDGWPEESRGALLAFFRSLFALVLLAPLVRRVEFRRAMLPMTICFAVMVWSFMSAMVYVSAASVIWLQYLSPAWVMLGAVTILKDRVGVAEVRMFLFCIAGVALIVVMELREGGNLLATLLAILSGITFAGVVLSMRSMSEVDSAWLITLNHAAAVILLLPWAWSTHQTIQVSAYVALGAFGVIQMSIPYILFARGLRQVNSAEASMLILIEPVLVPIWVYIAWRHHPSYDPPQWWTLVGGGMIFVGLVQRYLPTVIRHARRRRT